MFARIRMAAMGLFMAVGASLATTQAHAFAATDLDPIGTEITSALAILSPWVFTIMASVLGFLLVVGLVKKGAKKAV